MIRKAFLLSAGAALVVAFVFLGPSDAPAGNEKVEICHIPPGNPDNFHTIKVSVNAVPAHVAHGDFLGSCSANCDALCDDGNACTRDCADSEAVTCYGEQRPPVDCSDGLGCTIDGCDPATGCSNEPVACDPPDLCTVSMCMEPDGSCAEMPLACPEGEECDLTTGDCVDVICPCWESVEALQAQWDSIGVPQGECDYPIISTRDFCQDNPTNGISSAQCYTDYFGGLDTFVTQVRASSCSSTGFDGVSPPSASLTPAQYDACIAVHDAFTARTNFDGPCPTRTFTCGMPTPAIGATCGTP